MAPSAPPVRVSSDPVRLPEQPEHASAGRPVSRWILDSIDKVEFVGISGQSMLSSGSFVAPVRSEQPTASSEVALMQQMAVASFFAFEASLPDNAEPQS